MHHALCEMLTEVLAPLIKTNQPQACAAGLSPPLLTDWYNGVLRLKNEIGQWVNKHTKHTNVSVRRAGGRGVAPQPATSVVFSSARLTLNRACSLGCPFPTLAAVRLATRSSRCSCASWTLTTTPSRCEQAPVCCVLCLTHDGSCAVLCVIG